MNKHMHNARAKGQSDPSDTPAHLRIKKSTAIRVLHEDDAIIVVDKPAGVALDTDFDDAPGVLGQLIAAGTISEDGTPQSPLPVEPDASGLLVLARTAPALDTLARQLEDGTLELQHIALVRGRPGDDSGSIEAPLLNHPAGKVRPDETQGKPAKTDWRLRDGFIEFALIECVPRTAIRHQVRAHLEAAGMPLVVDREYGGGTKLMLSSFKARYHPSKKHKERPLIRRLTLHAETLSLHHPVTNEAMRFDSPPPKDMRAAIHQLERFGRVP